MALSLIPSSSNTPQFKYNVFLSFRGQDTRYNFTDHLKKALGDKDILTFTDDEIDRGDEISPSLLQAIDESQISIIVFSKDYASSRWCLEELVKIIECREQYRQTVIPVFYEIDPTDVRNQTGSFADAFAKHEQESLHKVQRWKDALIKAANLSGWHSAANKSESQLIEDIVKDVFKKLNDMSPSDNKNLVGIDSRIELIESCLNDGLEPFCWHAFRQKSPNVVLTTGIRARVEVPSMLRLNTGFVNTRDSSAFTISARAIRSKGESLNSEKPEAIKEEWMSQDTTITLINHQRVRHMSFKGLEIVLLDGKQTNLKCAKSGRSTSCGSTTRDQSKQGSSRSSKKSRVSHKQGTSRSERSRSLGSATRDRRKQRSTRSGTTKDQSEQGSLRSSKESRVSHKQGTSRSRRSRSLRSATKNRRKQRSTRSGSAISCRSTTRDQSEQGSSRSSKESRVSHKQRTSRSRRSRSLRSTTKDRRKQRSTRSSSAISSGSAPRDQSDQGSSRSSKKFRVSHEQRTLRSRQTISHRSAMRRVRIWLRDHVVLEVADQPHRST